VTSSHDVERALVQGLLDIADDRLADATAVMRADLDRLAESWRAGYAQQLADHEARMRKLDEDHQAWLRSLYADDDSEPQPTQDVAAGGLGDAPASSSSGTDGHGPRQQPDPRVAAELAEAERIRSMPMNEYAAMRAELGVQSPTDLNRLFGETRR
jgi:hypothetical protein